MAAGGGDEKELKALLAHGLAMLHFAYKTGHKGHLLLSMEATKAQVLDAIAKKNVDHIKFQAMDFGEMVKDGVFTAGSLMDQMRQELAKPNALVLVYRFSDGELKVLAYKRDAAEAQLKKYPLSFVVSLFVR